MADTSNLSNYLKDVADAIRTKKETTEQIPAEQFDQEILSIETGVDTSDADATSADLVWGKTAYVNGEKVTGNISESRGGTVLGGVPNEFTISDNPGVQNAGMVIKGVSMGSTGSAGAVADDTTTFHINPFKRDVAQGLNLTPDKIVKGNTILGVEGAAESGIDTSDADATAHDIIESKTAYVNGEKITGTFPLYGNIGSATNMDPDSSVIDNPEAQMVRTITHKEHSAGYTDNAMVETDTFYDKLVPAIGLTADKIVKGNTILGVEGTAEGGSGTGEIKLFETEEQMQADENPQKGDKAVVYRKQIQPIQQDTEFQVCEFPITVTLDTVITENISGSFSAIDTSIWMSMNVSLSATALRVRWYGNDTDGEVTYTSEDGVTYTRTDTLGNPVDLGVIVKSDYRWNDVFSKFIYASGYHFGGLFEYGRIVDEGYVSFPLITDNTTISSSDVNVLNSVSNRYNTQDLIDLCKEIEATISTNSGSLSMFLKNDELYAIGYKRKYNNNIYCEELHNTIGEDGLISNSVFYSKSGAATSINDLEAKLYKIDLVNKTFSLDTSLKYTTSVITTTSGSTTYYNLVVTFNEPVDSFCIQHIYERLEFPSIYEKVDGTSTTSSFDVRPMKCDMNYYYMTYYNAPTQLNIANANELLFGKIAYGKTGIITGDGSIYDNLDIKELDKNYMTNLANSDIPSDQILNVRTNIPFGIRIFKPTLEPYSETILSNTLQRIPLLQDYNTSIGGRIFDYKIDTINNKIEVYKATALGEITKYTSDLNFENTTSETYSIPSTEYVLNGKVIENKMYLLTKVGENTTNGAVYCKVLDIITGTIKTISTLFTSDSYVSACVGYDEQLGLLYITVGYRQQKFCILDTNTDTISIKNTINSASANSMIVTEENDYIFVVNNSVLYAYKKGTTTSIQIMTNCRPEHIAYMSDDTKKYLSFYNYGDSKSYKFVSDLTSSSFGTAEQITNRYTGMKTIMINGVKKYAMNNSVYDEAFGTNITNTLGANIYSAMKWPSAFIIVTNDSIRLYDFEGSSGQNIQLYINRNLLMKDVTQFVKSDEFLGYCYDKTKVIPLQSNYKDSLFKNDYSGPMTQEEYDQALETANEIKGGTEQ